MGKIEGERQHLRPDVMWIDYPESDVLVVSFGSTRDEFELVQTMSNFKVNQLYLKDFENMYYHKGLRNVCRSLHGIVSLIKKHIAEREISRSVAIGTSMGGYAALLFGYLCEMDVVHAFAPQTVIKGKKLQRMIDQRFSFLYGKPTMKKYHDLAVTLTPSTKTEYNIHYDIHEIQDVSHAYNMCSVSNVIFYPWMFGKHQLLWDIREKDLIIPLFDNIIKGKHIELYEPKRASGKGDVSEGEEI